MKIRDLLEIELWSKGTSRMLLAVLGLVCGLVVAGALSWRVVEANWITPGERTAARAALAQLDALQDAGSISDQDFSARAMRAEGKVDSAEMAAWTARDKAIVGELMGYQSVIMVDRLEVRDKALSPQGDLPFSDADREWNDELQSSGIEVERAARAALHNALD